MMFVELFQVEIAQFVVADPVGKRVIDGHQDFVAHRHRHRRALVPSASFESVKFVSQVSALSFGGCVDDLYYGRLQVYIALGDAAALGLAAGFVIARTNAGPRC
jgi:hypothetical protein